MTQKALVTADGKIVTIDREGTKSIPVIPGTPTFPWIADGEGFIKPITGKVKEEHIQKEVRQIEVVLTEPGAITVTIDLTPLNLIEGSHFVVSTNINYVSNLGVPVNGRAFMRFNNIATSDYSIAASPNNALGVEATDSDFTSHYLPTNLIAGELIGSYNSFRFDGTTRRTIRDVWTLRNNNIELLESLLIYTALGTQFYKIGTKFTITKLN